MLSAWLLGATTRRGASHALSAVLGSKPTGTASFGASAQEQATWSGTFAQEAARCYSSIPMPISDDKSGSGLGLGLGSSGSPLLPYDDESQSRMTPTAVVDRLNRFIVGQEDAKKAVAVAFRNRWRRHRVRPDSLREEIQPKNILMIGPTGCGKSEIARRLAKLADAPFIKVEATKFTEVGYHGRDVDSIIKDLVENAILLVRQKLRERAASTIRQHVEAALLKLIMQQHPEEHAHALASATAAAEQNQAASGKTEDVPSTGAHNSAPHSGSPGQREAGGSSPSAAAQAAASQAAANELLKERLRNHELEGLSLEVEVPSGGSGPGGGKGPFNIDLGNLGGAMGGMGQGSGMAITLERFLGSRKEKRRMSVAEARSVLEEAEAERMFPADAIAKEAVRLTENDGIVFIDELDKIVPGREAAWRGGDPSSEGVQRDLLPIIEGSMVQTKHGNVSTDHVLFICSGAFHSCKPSDLMAELQGRLPIRVELRALGRDDFYRILTEPQFNLIKQQQMLLGSEGVDLHFTEAAVHEVARIAEEANRALENIGARRLHTVIERIVEPISFSAPDLVSQARAAGTERYHAVVDKEQVLERLSPLLETHDLSKFII